MDKQQAQLKQLFEQFGFDADAAETMSASFLSPAEGAEPVLPFQDIHNKVLEYSKPHLKPVFKKELSKDFKGQYIGEVINKIVALSDNKLSRKDFERLNDEDDNAMRALEALIATKGNSGKKEDEAEIARKYNELVKQLEEKETEWNGKVEAVHKEYAEKENQRHIYDHTLSILSGLEKPTDGKPGQKISVDHQRAAQLILRELQDVAALKFDPQSKSVTPFSKEDPEIVYMHDGKQAKYADLVQAKLKENNWLQQSNGGAGAGALDKILKQQQPGASTAAGKAEWGGVFKQQIADAAAAAGQ